MAIQTATFTTAQAQALRQNLPDFLQRLNGQGNPDNQVGAVTILTDTAGTVTFNVAAHQNNAAYSKAVTASVA